ncbi:MAG TPA: ribosomal protein L7/L12 [Propionicimonas sp.]|jgi:large subunit ribosomal protein L7/L12|uniref:ribosomal protein L7/L12 n=1 Tax=Propionicimonas sp. TaxID=1955623 RepID=UPI002F3F6772
MGIFGDGGSRDDYLQLEARVATLETMVAQLAGTVASLSASASSSIPGAPGLTVTGQRWEVEARVLKQADKLIDAIKVVREATGWGLRESKDFVERL